MFLAVGLQAAVVLGLAILVGGVWSREAALSLVYGGAAAIVPNALFAVRLALHRGRSPESYPAVFFLGEIVKIGLTVAMLVWAAKSMPQLQWPALVAGLIAALHAPFLLPLVARGNESSRPTDGAGHGHRPDATRPQPPTTENR